MPQPQPPLPRPTSTRLRAGPPRFQCTSSNEGANVTWLDVAGELDVATSPELKHVLEKALRHAWLVVLDLRNLAFIDTTGVHVIVDVTALARRRDRRLVVMHRLAAVRTVFDLTNTSDAVEIREMDPADSLARRSGQVERGPKQVHLAF